ncbi:hypothetical protein HPB50_027985 [Hyalomma asiaticum]|nr:hypothetical protein HPB50_027985 [Hyalomma asiaticum]
MPPLPLDDFKIVYRRQAGLELAKWNTIAVMDAIGIASGLPQQHFNDKVRVQVQRIEHLIIASNTREEDAKKLVSINTIQLGGTFYNVNGNIRTPDDISRGIVDGIIPGNSTAELMAGILALPSTAEPVATRDTAKISALGQSPIYHINAAKPGKPKTTNANPPAGSLEKGMKLLPTSRPATDFYRLIHDIKKLTNGHQVVLVGDFNGSHTAWGYQNTKGKGGRVHDTAQHHGLTLCNDLQNTRIGNIVSRDTNPDLTFTTGVTWAEKTKKAIARLTEWKSFMDDPYVDKSFRDNPGVDSTITDIDQSFRNILDIAERHNKNINLDAHTPAVDANLLHLWEA